MTIASVLSKLSVTPLLKMKLRVSIRRLKKTSGLLASTLVAMPLVAALSSLGLSWSWVVGSRSLHYSNVGQLWALQIVESERWRTDFGPTIQASLEGARRLALPSAALSEVAVARPKALPSPSKELSGTPFAVSVNGFSVSPNYWSLTGFPLIYGRYARAASGEAVISERLARVLSNRPHEAVGGVLFYSGGALTVSGVFSDDVLAPLPLARQRDRNSLVDVYVADFAAEQLSWAPKEAGEMVLVARARQFNSRDDENLQRLVTQIGQELGRSGWRVEVGPLEQMVLGDSRIWSIAVAVASFIVLSVTLLGIALTGRSHYARRGAARQTLGALGVPVDQVPGFELVENFLVTCLGWLFCGATIILLVFSALIGDGNWAFVTPKFLGMCLLFATLVFVLQFLILEVASRSFIFKGFLGAPLRAGARRGIGARVSIASYRLILAGQVIVAVLAVAAAGFGLGDAVRAWNAWFSLDLDRVWQVEVNAGLGNTPAEVEGALSATKEALQREFPGSISAISISPPLDLVGQEIAYSGPKFVRGVVEELGDGAVFVRSTGSPRAEDLDTVRYRLSLAEVEPSFFSVMGYSFNEGRPFAIEREEVVFSSTAADLLWGRDRGLLDEAVPGPPAAPGARWHNDLSVVGIVEDLRIERYGLGSGALGRAPVAFVAYRGVPAPNSLVRPSVFLSTKLPYGSGDIRQSFIKPLHRLIQGGARIDVAYMEDAAWARVRTHLLSAACILFLGAATLVAVSAGAYGAASLLIERRSTELSVKRAIGVTAGRLVYEFLAKELAIPFLASMCTLIALLSLAPVISGDDVQHGALTWAALSGAFVSVAAAACGMGFGIASAVRSSPARLLREVEATQAN